MVLSTLQTVKTVGVVVGMLDCVVVVGVVVSMMMVFGRKRDLGG